MNCGRSSAASSRSSGFGWRWTGLHARLSALPWVIVPPKPVNAYGQHCHQSIAAAPSSTRIIGTPMRVFFHQSGIDQLIKGVVKPTISSASTTRCVNAVAVLSAKPCPLAATSGCMKSASACSSNSTTHPCQFSLYHYRSTVGINAGAAMGRDRRS